MTTALLLWLGAGVLAAVFIMLEARLIRRGRVRRSALNLLAYYDEQGRLP